VGSNIAVSGSGFEPNQDITLYFDGSSVDTECRSKGDGSFRYCVLTIPAAIAGTHTVTASDAANSASAGYTVNPGVSLTPSTGPVGSGAAVSGSGFDAGAPITLSFDGNTVSMSCTANAVGSFSNCEFTVPAATQGRHTVTASDYSTNVAAVGFYHAASAAYTVGASFSLNPNIGAVGSTVTLNGSNYTPNSILRVSFDGSRRPTSGTCTTDAKGNLPASNNCAFTIPTEAAGVYNVTVSDGTYSGTTIFTVTPALSLTASAGAVDSEIAFSGSGFASFDPITVSFDGRNVSSSCTADATGSFSFCTLTVPDTTGGTHTVTTTDPHGDSAAASYTVDPAIDLTSGAGAAGSSVALTGSGFKANATIAVSFDGQSVSTSCTTDANGSITPCAFTVPAVAAGIHTVTASDGTGYSASASYTIGAAFSLNPTAGAVGSLVTLSGSNYTPNSTLTVTFNGAALGTFGICTTDASGYLLASNNCAFTVPATTAGSYTVTVSDGTYSGSATFTVTRGISLIPSAGPVGSLAAVSGSGFTPRRTIALTFGGSSIPVTALGGTPCISDASGRFSACAFAVPATTAGSYTVTAWDGTYSASATYTVQPVISLLSSAGPVGSNVTVSGSGFASFAPITVNFNGSSVATSCTTNASGGVSACTFKVPAAPAGPQTVTASDGTTAGTTTSTFTVKPLIWLASSAGTVGSTAMVNGSGFARKDKITLTFDGGKVSTSCTTDATGSFSPCTFTVPAASAAAVPHTVAAADSKANSASASYRVI
jgi:hypothetical protein